MEYVAHCDARVAPYCANVTGLHYCLEDPQYPEYDIKLAISQDYLFEKKYSDVVDQSANDLVESIPAQQVWFKLIQINLNWEIYLKPWI